MSATLRNAMLVLALAGIAGVANAQIPTFGKPYKDCTTNKCDIDVQAEITPVIGCLISSIKMGDMDEWASMTVTQPNTRITWKLKDDFVFCASRGDGVFFDDDPNYQFQDGTFELEEQATVKTGCKRNFTINNLKTAPGEYKYTIRFRSKDNKNKVCERDPWIRN